MTLSGTIPTASLLSIRDQYLAPSLLAPFADDMARRLSRIIIGPILETSAGTGILTQTIASTMPASLHRRHRSKRRYGRACIDQAGHGADHVADGRSAGVTFPEWNFWDRNKP